MSHIVHDGFVRITDAINSKQFSRSSIKNAVRSLRAKIEIGKPGRPQAISKEKEETVLDVIKIDSICGSSLTMKKTRELMENVSNDTKEENEPHISVSNAAAYGFLKLHPELTKSKPKSLDINRLAVSCKSVMKPWYNMITDLHEKNHHTPSLIFNVDESSLRVPSGANIEVIHPTGQSAGFCKEAQRMDNATLVAAVAADGYSLPCIILWPSVKQPDELKPLLSPTLDIWPNKSGWMDKQNFKKYAGTVLLPSIVERRKRMSPDIEKYLLFIGSHPSRGDPSIWKTFSENNIDVVTFIPHSTHLSQPLDRGVFATLKTSLSSSFDAPSSTSSSASRKALVDVLPQAIHSAFTPSAIKKASEESGVIHNTFSPVLRKLPESSKYPHPSHRFRFDYFGKLITKKELLDNWERF
ncbi:uncharacterized protein MONOS_11603 [Monocercomonoides exilis]|uniref:uncharacterized protein n=1 Tax=Monocercomonoides exilis TaxID=2049356 RepID=UPI00355AA7BF|nr:hypothetical protein MONOS_11603 [Monocercomonoides exilis]|eukprot:MONOS_11603.1-p1 / transcript=MONOS_11603.1 / gene=MONOS_11603 / organism=Monocercomonoides_exilis_PA203 / gene_product=unspecified product / transcript_product=unspecified product / location=Mono_scaffold00591:23148-24427(+) / protein_length=411 / sequence_SO=supercontig / SO=protein_coding / is_pseudo=false